MNGYQRNFRFVVSFGFSGQGSGSKPPQTIYKPLALIGKNMTILGKNPAELVSEDIDRMIESQVPESKTLDYKAELKIEKGDYRKEFLADISAFINT